MKHTKYIAVSALFALVFYSCDPCGSLDCATDSYYGQFRIVNDTDGKDLVFGPTKIYDKDQIRFYSLKGVDTTFFDCQALRFPGPGYDSILYVYFFSRPDIAYMQLSNNDVDTFNITYNTIDSKCCGTITEIKNFRFNNSTDIPGTNGTQEIRK